MSRRLRAGRVRVKLLVIVASALALVALALGVQFRRNVPRLMPLDAPIKLQRGHTTSQLFSVDLASRYEIRVDIGRPMPYEWTREIEVDWTVTTDRTVIAEGSAAQNPYFGESAGWIIGRFAARPNTMYTLVVRVRRDVSDPAVLNPRVQVHISADPATTKTQLMLMALALLASFSAVVSIVLFVTAGGLWYVDRKKRHGSIQPASGRGS